jgi:hypothetical protein
MSLFPLNSVRQFPISSFAFACVLFFVLLPKTALTQASPEPLTEAKILDGLTRGAISPGRMATLVEQRGVDFTLTTEIEKELRNAGADDALIQAISRAKVQQKAALVIDADADCTVTINGTSFEMKAGEEKVVAAAVGENVVRAVSKQDASKVWRKVILVQSSEQKAVLIELRQLPTENNSNSTPASATTNINPTTPANAPSDATQPLVYFCRPGAERRLRGTPRKVDIYCDEQKLGTLAAGQYLNVKMAARKAYLSFDQTRR